MRDDVVALQRRIRELQEQLAAITTERDLAVADRHCAVAELAHAYDLQSGQAVPVELAHALRSVSPHRLQGVRLTVDGHELHVLVDGAAYLADPGVEGRVWAWLTEHACAPPSHALARLEMPERLHAVAWPRGEIGVSLALSGPDVVAAHRALRPRRPCGLLRALSLLAIPGFDAGRSVLSVLREAQTATATAASTATTAATTAAGTALPAFTAAAISCTAVTSCTPVVGAARPPAKAQALDQSAPPVIAPAAPGPYTLPRRTTSPSPSPTEDAADEQIPQVVVTEPAGAPQAAPEPDAQRKTTPVPIEEAPSAPPAQEPPLVEIGPESDPVVAETDTPEGGEPAPSPPPGSEVPAPAGPAPVEPTPVEDAPPEDEEPADDGSPLEESGAPTSSPDRPLTLASA